MNIPTLWRIRQQRYRLCSTYCVVCGSVFFPPRPVCPACRLSLPVTVQNEALLLLETAPGLLDADLSWSQPYALPLFTAHTAESTSQ